jgi:transposase InsO family protein
MKVHGNARLTPAGRALMCARVREQGWTIEEAADAAGVSMRCCFSWLARWDAGESMADRSSRPKTSPTKTSRELEAVIEELRRLRWTSTRIAGTLAVPTSTVCAVLNRLGLNRLWKLEPPEPPNRYCRRHAGELVHIDIKKLGRFDVPGHRVTGRGKGRHGNRGVGWEFVYVAVDDTTRLAYVEILANERADTAEGFLHRTVAWFASQGVTVREVMTDNGSPFVSKTWAARCKHLTLRHRRTRPYRPRTNGKAERFIQTLLREWAYARAYPSSHHRRRALRPWIRYYNCQRPHGGLGHKTPSSQLG